MRKLYGLAALIILISGLSAEENPVKQGFDLSAGTSFGLLNGRADEIVYRAEGSDTKLSELRWYFTPLIYVGAELELGWRSPRSWGLFAEASFKYGFPGETGAMEDRDWVHSDYAEFLTHYSVHNNTTEKAALIDAGLGASFQILNNFLLKTYVSYSYMLFSWSAKGGSFLYPESAGGHVYYLPDNNGKAVEVGTYEQAWNIVSPGVSFSGGISRYFHFELSLRASPFIWCSTTDDHIQRGLLITGRAGGGLYIDSGLVLSFMPRDYLVLSLSAAYRNISRTRGDGVYSGNEVYDDYGTYSVRHKNILGAGYRAFDVGLSAEFRVF
ncbi:MAG: omptin family outer membrane protease [Spirochaetaceae bacterium]|jgi:outer membrane protease|nr:omptin family outer membrane protease [Spirochaetaceae bacterium]